MDIAHSDKGQEYVCHVQTSYRQAHRAMIPDKLYRYRPIDAALLERELAALDKAFLWSPHFREMNDPMEAFYELGDSTDAIVDRFLAPSGKSTRDLYEMARKVVDNFCLVSFSTTPLALPMWAYYASNFAGLCLEFRTDELFTGDFQTERLMPVTYADEAPPPIAFQRLATNGLQTELEACVSRKRTEWRHEGEWRILTGAGGARHYLDDALTRIFLGPRMDDAHAERICEIFRERPTEILRGEVRGYDLTFATVKPALPVTECRRVGSGELDLDELLYSREAIEEFLDVPIGDLEILFKDLAARPNAEAVVSCDLSGEHKGKALYVWTTYRLRSGREVWKRIHLDSRLNLLPTSD